jgi:hypothetical protein
MVGPSVKGLKYLKQVVRGSISDFLSMEKTIYGKGESTLCVQQVL